VSEKKLRIKRLSQKDRLNKIIDILPDDLRKEALKYYLKIPKTRNIVEKRVYKARVLNIICTWVSKNRTEEKRYICRLVKKALREL